MPESFGARLRRRREEQNVALSTIAEQTKIKLSLLEGLERDDVSHWPSGIFRRAYLRSYAHAIGLCPDATLREFLERHPDPEEAVTAAAAVLAAAERAGTLGGPPSRLRNIVGSAIGSLSRLRRGPAAGPLAAPKLPRASETTAFEPDDRVVAHLTVGAAEPNQAIATTGVLAATDVLAFGSDADDAAEPSDLAGQLHATPVFDEESGSAEPALTEPAPSEPAPWNADLEALAQLCTELGQIDTADALPSLLNEAARLLDATGLILWIWDGAIEELRPTLAHGYSDRVLAQLPGVKPEDENATAAAFRSRQPCAIAGDDRNPGAFVVPLLTPLGCAGVLALELRHGGEQSGTVRALAAIVAAFLAQLTGGAASADETTDNQLTIRLGST